MGLDVGDKKIGIALSDSMGWTAQGYSVIERKNLKGTLCKIKKIVERYDVTQVIIGLPKNMNGSIGPQGEKILKFAEELGNIINNIEIKLWDERLTTIEAEKTLIEADLSRRKRKQVIDKLAAVLILQNYLDSRRLQER
jgi:putative Holliday junction resolvase